MYRIIYTRWIDEVRRDNTRTANLVVLRNEDNFKSDTNHSGTRLTQSMDIQRALETLSQEHRAAIMLVSVEGYSYTEASTVLNVPVGTVASRVARARTLLGKLLSRRSHDRAHATRQARGER
jgi:RNA polymerase sigma-70 factor (ECF subfamily)